ncbi:MAG: type II toxin-antitoxin system HicA family toxin [Defluviitaleaceae bacterium]|nr:type II toxin-antitoxin system HicA family toxin [Defluviitaleaceae bacterium]
MLRSNGCYLVRQAAGDHERWFSPITGRKFTVDGDVDNRHTANGILKEAGIKQKL